MVALRYILQCPLYPLHHRYTVLLHCVAESLDFRLVLEDEHLLHHTLLADGVLDGGIDGIVGLLGLHIDGEVEALEVSDDVIVFTDADPFSFQIICYFWCDFLLIYI